MSYRSSFEWARTVFFFCTFLVVSPALLFGKTATTSTTWQQHTWGTIVGGFGASESLPPCDPTVHDCAPVNKCDPNDIDCLTKAGQGGYSTGHKAPKITARVVDLDATDVHYLNGRIAALSPTIPILEKDFWTHFKDDLKLESTDLLIDQTPTSKPLGDEATGPHTFGIHSNQQVSVYKAYKQFFKKPSVSQPFEVLGMGYTVEADKDGNVVYALGKTLSIPSDFDVTPKISETDAFHCAENALTNSKDPIKIEIGSKLERSQSKAVETNDMRSPKTGVILNNISPTGVLAINADQKPQLVWLFKNVKGYTLEIDASAAGCKVVRLSNNVAEDSDSFEAILGRRSRYSDNNIYEDWGQEVPCSGKSLYDGTVSFTAEQSNDKRYRLMSKVISDKGSPISPTVVFDDRHPNMQDGEEHEIAIFADADNPAECDFEKTGDDIGMNVMKGLQETLKWYDRVHQWKGFDDIGKDAIRAYVAKMDSNHAYYDGASNSIVFSSKGGASLQGSFAKVGPPVSYDVIAHEFTHGIIRHTSDLKYWAESASLNEGFATLFGLLVRGALKGESWSFEKDMGWPVQDVGHPKNTGDPDTYKGENYVDMTTGCTGDNDYCGAHQNSTILSHWFYDFVKGSAGINDLKHKFSVKGVCQDNPDFGCIEDASRIPFSIMTQLLKGVPTAGFQETRLASLKAIADMYADNPDQYMTVKKAAIDAWYAVGVGEKDDPRFYYPSTGSGDWNPWPINLSWEVTPDEVGTTWEVEVSKDRTFPANDTFHFTTMDIGEEDGLPGNKAMSWISFNAEPNKTYYWHVRKKPEAKYGKGGNQFGDQAPTIPEELEKAWGATLSFQTRSTAAELVSPIAGEETHEFSVDLEWKAVEGAAGYRYFISDDPTAGCDEKNTLATTGFFFSMDCPNGLFIDPSILVPKSGDLWWWIETQGPEDQQGNPIPGECSKPGYFKSDFQDTKPQPKYPLSSDQVPTMSGPIVFKWTPVKDAAGYVVTLLKKDDMSVISTVPFPKKLDSDGLAFGYMSGAGDQPDGACWQVKAIPYLGDEASDLGVPSDVVCYGTLGKPVLTSPQDKHALIAGKPVTYYWQALPGITEYKIWIMDSQTLYAPGGGGVVPVTVDNASSYTDTQDDQSVGSGRCWQVAGISPDGKQGPVSDLWCYSIYPGGNIQMTMTPSPVNGTDLAAAQTELSFEYPANPALGGKNYGCFLFNEISDPSQTPPPDLYPAGTTSPCNHLSENGPAGSVGYNSSDAYFSLPVQVETGHTYYWQAFRLADDNQTILEYSNVWAFRGKTANCGDGIQDVGEDCDCGDAAHPNPDCPSPNNDSTPDACRTTCKRPTCGDGVKDSSETCDNGANNSDTVPDACRTNCQPAQCGDGVADTGEECGEPGLTSDCSEKQGAGAYCGKDCKCATNTCGDGIPGGANEVCDDGPLNGQPDHCNSTCTGMTAPICGNTAVEAGEQCDPPNGSTCSASCQTITQPPPKSCTPGSPPYAITKGLKDTQGQGVAIIPLAWTPTDNASQYRITINGNDFETINAGDYSLTNPPQGQFYQGVYQWCVYAYACGTWTGDFKDDNGDGNCSAFTVY